MRTPGYTPGSKNVQQSLRHERAVGAHSIPEDIVNLPGLLLMLL
jgi:hypothetical protein